MCSEVQMCRCADVKVCRCAGVQPLKLDLERHVAVHVRVCVHPPAPLAACLAEPSAPAHIPPGSIFSLENPANFQFLQKGLLNTIHLQQNHLVTLKWLRFRNIQDSLTHFNT